MSLQASNTIEFNLYKEGELIKTFTKSNSNYLSISNKNYLIITFHTENNP